jgi:hypothetical protein
VSLRTGKSQKINTHALVLLIKIYSTGKTFSYFYFLECMISPPPLASYEMLVSSVAPFSEAMTGVKRPRMKGVEPDVMCWQ